MTISSQTRKAGPFVGNDSTTAFPFAFKVFSAADMYVVKTDTDLEVETVLVLNTDYTVSLNADQNANPGGTITLPSALATGFTLTVTSNISPLQQTDLTNQGGFYPSVITNALDKLTILIQQALDSIGRSLKLPVSTPSGVSTTLPLPSSNKLIGWNTAGDGLQNVDPTTLATIVAFGTANADVFDGDGVTTQFNLSANPAALNNLDVSIGGVTQTPVVDYTWTSGTVITFTSAPPVGTDNVLVRYMQALPQGTTDAGSSFWTDNGGDLRDVESALQRITGEWLSVKDPQFGATGDGVTDDTAALNAAATAAKALGVGLIVPAGLYVTTAPWVIPPGVPVIGIGQSWPVPGYNPTTRLYGAVIWKKHTGHGVTITGASAYDSAAPIQNLTIISNNTTWAAGNGFVLDKVTRCHLIDCNVWSVGGDAFVIGVTAGDVTGHNYLTRCYSNNPAGVNFRIRAKWTRCDTIVSDGGTWGAVLDAAPETEIKSWHFEGYSTGCLDVTNGSTSFAATGKGFMGNTAAAVIGIRIKNDAGNVGARINNVYGAGGGTASSIGIDVVGASAEDAQISGCLLEGWATGVRDTSTNTQILNNKFYNNTLPISAGGTASIIQNNRTQATTGSWSIDHVAGGSGIWTGNNLDQPIKSTSSGVAGNYGTNLVRANKGFKTRAAGITGGVSGGSTVIAHGLIAVPSTQFVTLVGSSGATDIRASSDATNITISWTGAGTYQFSWEVACTCERQY